MRGTWRHRERWGRGKVVRLSWGFGSRNCPQGPGDKLLGAHLLREGRYTTSPAASGRAVSLRLCCTNIAHVGLNIWDFLLLLLIALGSGCLSPASELLCFLYSSFRAVSTLLPSRKSCNRSATAFQNCEWQIANRRRMETLRKVTELSVRLH